MNHPTDIFSPDIAIILPVRHSHSGNFHILQDLINEKLSIVTNHTKVVIAPQEYKILINYIF
jgi:UDP-N-acetylmuramyl pentapeptide synthase